MRALILLIFSFLVFIPAQTEAAHPRFRLEILPIDCIFEFINDGSGDIIYLTPEECGKFLEPDDQDGDNLRNEAGTEDGRIRVPDSFFHGGLTYEADESEAGIETEATEASEENDPTTTGTDYEPGPLSLIEPQRQFAFWTFTIIFTALLGGTAYLFFAWRRRSQQEE